MAANCSESDEEVDVEGVTNQDFWTSIRDSSMQEETNASTEKGFRASILFPSANTALFSTDSCDANMWLDSMWSLDHCEDEKSRAAIEKMILEEEMYLQDSPKVYETREAIRTKSSTRKQRSKVKKPCVSQIRKPWTIEEVKLFENGLKMYGRSWSRIAGTLDGRTSLQVKNFASRYLKKCPSSPSSEKQESCLGNAAPLDGFSGKEHLSVPTVCSVETQEDLDEDNTDVDIDVDGDDDSCGNPLIPGQSLAPDEIYSKLVKSALHENEENFQDSDSSSSNEGDFCCGVSVTEHCTKNRVPEDIGKSENEPELISQTPAVITPHFHTEKNDKSLNTKPEPLCASSREMESSSCPLSSKENMEAIDKACASECNVECYDEEKHGMLSERESALLSVEACATDAKENSFEHEQSLTYSRNGELDLMQKPRTRTEVTVTATLPTNERFQPVSGADGDTAENIIIQRDTIHEEEKVANNEFFMGRSLKTPERYMRIRNYILDMWEQTKPHYLFKTSVRSGLKSCGDVNSIGRVHAFLEDINAINVGCPVIPQPRLARVRNYSEIDTTKDKPMESWVNILRPRKRRLHTVKGEWIDENTAEGVTITHASDEEEEQEKDLGPIPVRRSRRPRPRPTSYDPFQLIPCRKFPSTSVVPFEVCFSSCAVVVMDTHAHLSTTEVIGLLGGKYYPQSKKLEVQEASPCESLSTGMQCEMDPVSQTEASESLAKRGLSVVGWYHSHPTFAASPSIRDIDTQAKFQEWFGKGGAPFIGVIVSPYNYTNSSNQSQLTCLTVSDDWNTTSQYRLPYHFDYSVLNESINFSKALQQLKELTQRYSEKKSRIRLTLQYSGLLGSAITIIDKLLESIASRLRGDENDKRDFVEKVKELLLSSEQDCSTNWENKIQDIKDSSESFEKVTQLPQEEKQLLDDAPFLMHEKETTSLIHQSSNEERSHLPLLEDSKQLHEQSSALDAEGDNAIVMNCFLLGAEEIVTTSDVPLETSK